MFLLSKDAGVPEEGYPVNMEGLHQLHCLNLLRQSLHFNYEYYHESGAEGFNDKERTYQLHVGHCVDMLRETIMCSASTDVMPYLWLNEDGDTIPDFGREKRCRNFDSVRAWVEAHHIRMPENHSLNTSARSAILLRAVVS